MRLNKFLAQHTDLSRRKADDAIKQGLVTIDGNIAEVGNEVKPTSVICLNGVEIKANDTTPRVVLVNKPVGYVCSRNGQGSPTVYDLLREADKDLNIAGRLDKDSSGLVILTDDGELLNELTHPSYSKEKVYEVVLNRELTQKHINILTSQGVDIGDERPSKFISVEKIAPKKYKVILTEGRNRQIRRTFEYINCRVMELHRIEIGKYKLSMVQRQNK